MLDLHRHYLRAEPVRGNFERQQGPRRILEEGVDDGQPVKPMIVAPRLAVIGKPALALVEDGGDLTVAEVVDGKQVH